MRGEESGHILAFLPVSELPPHARRRAHFISTMHTQLGITSACAEKRPNPPRPGAPNRNYLRMRGEEGVLRLDRRLKPELPPHARRRALSMRLPVIQTGITSACAEKRRACRMPLGIRWNYLRMRGEEDAAPDFDAFDVELPPHARRRAGLTGYLGIGGGITSACAEKSRVPSLGRWQ